VIVVGHRKYFTKNNTMTIHVATLYVTLGKTPITSCQDIEKF